MTIRLLSLSKTTDSLDEFFQSFGTCAAGSSSQAAAGEGVETTEAGGFFCREPVEFKTSSDPSNTAWNTILTSTTIPDVTTTTNKSSLSFDEFGFPFFPPNVNVTTTKTSSPPVEEEKKEPDDDIDNNSQSDDYLIFPSAAVSLSSVSTMTKCTGQQVMNNVTNYSSATSGSSGKSRKRSVQRALSKLTLCGQSAKEDSLDLEYMVLSLRQALTAQEATESLRHMVNVLKRSKGGGGSHNGSSTSNHSKSSISLSPREIQEGLVEAGADHCVISTLWNFKSHVPVQYFGIVALGELVAHAHLANQKAIVMKGGIEVVLTAMKLHTSEESLQEESCKTLKNLMKYFDLAKQQVARCKGIARILAATMTHPEYAGVQRQACYALTSLSCLKVISDELVVKQGHAVLLKVMKHHNDDCFVLAEAWRTLTNIVIHSMNPTLDEEIAAHGMDFVCATLHNFSDCTLVPIQARGLTLLTHLCYRSPSNLQRLTCTTNLEIVQRILRIWKQDERVQAAGEKLVQLIQRQESKSIFRPIGGGGTMPPEMAVISEIRTDSGTDVIVDTTAMY